MNNFKRACFIPLLAVGVATAAPLPCEGFKIIVGNKLTEQLVIHKAQVQGASIRFDGAQVLEAKAEHNFTVSNTTEAGVMQGDILLYNNAQPQKFVGIKFALKNNDAICEVEELPSDGNLLLTKTRLLGGVEYNITE